MSDMKTVKDLMVDAFEFPHLPYWFTIKQAVGVIRKTLIGSEKCVHPRVVLVFDEKYNLIGMLTFEGVLKGLEPHSSSERSGYDDHAVREYETGMFGTEMKKLLERPISDIMTPIRIFLAPEDPLLKAALVMLRSDLAFLPVLESTRKLVGIVRLAEVFGEVFDKVIAAK